MIIYDLPSKERPNGGMIRLNVEGYGHVFTSLCFAGEDDELVVAGSFCTWNLFPNLYVWSLPDGHGGRWIINEPLLVLRGHKSAVSNVRYSPYNCTLASCDCNGEIKLWTPFQLPNYVEMQETESTTVVEDEAAQDEDKMDSTPYLYNISDEESDSEGSWDFKKTNSTK